MSKARFHSQKQKALKHAAAGEWVEAERLLRGLCAADPKNGEYPFLLAAVLGNARRYDEAIAFGSKAIALAPALADAHYNLAQAYMHARRYVEAEASYRSFLRLNPGHAAAFNALGLALDSQDRPQEAFQCYRECVRLDPAQGDAWHNGGNAALTLGYRDDGIRFLRRATELRPDRFSSHICLGNALTEAGEIGEASTAFARARALDPAHADPVAGEAAILEKRGEHAAAWRLLEPLWVKGIRGGRFALTFAAVAARLGRQADGIAVLQDAIRSASESGGAGPSLHFALGDLYDQTGEYQRAFENFAEANRLTGAAANAEDSYLETMSVASRQFTRAFFESAPRATIATDRPIFIVGMPRSGTTLAEQIVASHPAVCAAGELTEIADIVEWLGPLTDVRDPEARLLVNAARLDGAARRYLNRLAAICPGSQRVTDKMPHNFLHLGLIALLFPHARIVHCHRNPLDNCFSIFTHEFSVAHGYAASLEKLGRHYCAYRHLMRHWRDVLPLAVFDLRYEALVANQEQVTRELLAFLDLDWDERCLRFHESKRIVNTPSYDQVRRPIYRASVARWRHYEQHLGPLIETLRAIEESGQAFDPGASGINLRMREDDR